MNYITGGHIILFQSLLFFKKLVKAPTRAFIVFNYCSCVRFKLAINELVSALLFHACFKHFLLLVIFYFFSCSLPAHFPLGSFHFFLSSSSAIPSSLCGYTIASTPELEPAWAMWWNVICHLSNRVLRWSPCRRWTVFDFPHSGSWSKFSQPCNGLSSTSLSVGICR